MDCIHRKNLQCPLICSGRIPILSTLYKVLTSKRGPQCSFVEKHFVSTIHLKNKTTARSSSHSVSPLFTSVQHLLWLIKGFCIRDHHGWSSSHTDMSMTASASQMNFDLYSVKILSQQLFSWETQTLACFCLYIPVVNLSWVIQWT